METEYLVDDINFLINYVLNSSEEYDNRNEEKCGNYLFYTQLLSPKQRGIDCKSVLSTCVASKRKKYLEYMLSINEKLKEHNKALENEDVWYEFATSEESLDSKRLGELIDKNYHGFEFSALKDDSKYWKILSNIRNNTAKYSRQQPEQSETFKALKLLLEQKEIQELLTKNELLIHKMMDGFICNNLQACFDLMVEMNEKNGLGWNLKHKPNYDNLHIKLDFNAHPSSGLLYVIDHGELKISKRVIESGLYDINYVGFSNQMNSLLCCANSTSGYVKGVGVKQCDNYRLFTYLLDQPGIDVTATDVYGQNVIALLFTNEKPEYIDYIRERIENRETDNWNGNLTEEMIDRMIEKYEKLEEIITAVVKSDVKRLNRVLDDKTTQVIIKDIINLCGYSRQTKSSGNALSLCIESKFNYNFENPTKCDNYRCFIKLLQQKGINPNERFGSSSGYGAAYDCLSARKIEYCRILVDTFNSKLNVSDKDGRRITIDKNIISADKNLYYNILRWAVEDSYDSEALKFLFKLVYDDKRFDINQLFILCCKSVVGYNSRRARTCENFKKFQFLLQQPGINLNRRLSGVLWKDETTALIELIVQNKHEYLEYIFELQRSGKKKFNIDFDKQLVNIANADLLYLAVDACYPKCVRALLKASDHWDVNKKQTRSQRTVALLAARASAGYDQFYPFVCNAFETFRMLLNQKGIDLNISSVHGGTPIQCMIHGEDNKDKWIEHILDEWKENRLKHVVADISKEKMQHYRKMYKKTDELARVCKFSDYDALQRILDNPENKEDIGEYVNYFSREYDNRPLDALCEYTQWGFDSENQLECRNFKCFRALLEITGIKVVSYSVEQLVKNDKYGYIRYLVENNDRLGLKINFQDIGKIIHDGDLLMHVKAHKQSHKTLKVMLELGVFDINGIDWETGTLLHQCAANTDDYNPQYPFECDLFEFMKILLSHKSLDINTRDKEGGHMLQTLILSDKFEYFKYIVEASESDKYHWKLQDLGSIVNTDGENLLQVAALVGNVECLSYLLSKNVFDDVNCIGGIIGDTVLNVCIRSNIKYERDYYRECDNYKCLKMLLLDTSKGKNGKKVNPYIKNKMGYNAFDCCRRVGKLEYLHELKMVFDKK